MVNGPRSRVLVEGLRASLVLLLIMAVPFAVAWAVGLQLPEEHTSIASGVVQASPDRVWELLTDFSAQGNWRTGPLILVRGPKREAKNETCWMEGWLLTKVTLCELNAEPGRKRLVHSLGAFLPFDATWTYDLAPIGDSGSATTLTITEQTSIDSPLERFIGRYILRQNTATEQYLRDLQAEALRHP